MQSVKVGDDTKMRCQYCVGNTDPDFCEMKTTNSKYDIEIASPSDGRHMKDEIPLVRS